MPPLGDQLQLQREALRRGLWRASVASVAILLIVVALAMAVAGKAKQFQTEALRARAATERAQAGLWNAKLNEARARRIAGGPGARVESAASVRELVKRPDLEASQILALRQEAIAQLALVDVQISTNWIIKDRPESLFWNRDFSRYVKPGPAQGVRVRAYPGDEVVKSFETYTNATLANAVFSLDGEFLAGAFKDGQVRVWRIVDGDLLFSTRGTSDSRYSFPFFSPNGRLIGVVSSSKNWDRGDGLRLYDVNSGEVYLQLPVTPARAQFSPSGRYLAMLLPGELRVLDVHDGGRLTASLKVPFERFREFAWHPEGNRIAISGDIGRLWMWDVWTDTEPRTFVGHPNVITHLAFSPDGSLLLSYGWDSMANFWDPLSGRRLLAERRIAAHQFDAAGNIWAQTSRGQREGMQTLLSRTGFRTVAATGNAAQATEGVWIHPTGRFIAAAYPEATGVRVWKFPQGELIARLPGRWAQFTPDGRALLTFSEQAVRRYELHDEDSAPEWKEEIIYRLGKEGTAIKKGTIAADGKTLVIGEDNQAVLVDLAGECGPRKFKAGIQSGSLSPNGEWLITCKHQESGQLLNVKTGARLRSVPALTWAEFSPDGRYLAVLSADALSFYATNTWDRVRRIPLEVGAGTPPGFAFTADGQMFAVAYNRDDVRLFEACSGRELATLSSPNPVPITGGAGLAFSADARWLVAARQDGEIVAWELPVIRAELAKLGLDWGKTEHQTLVAAPLTRSAQRLSVSMVALLAALFAIGAGTFIFLMQRRMLAGYGRLEAMTLEQRGKLSAAESELLHSQKMRALGTLAAGIAHDFNNLLSVIRLSNQLAAEQTKATGAAKENMEAVETAVAQGETIVHSMLGYSRAAAENNQEYSVAAALSETVAMLGKKFLSGIVLQLEIEPSLPAVQGARGRLEQMLLNLVVNAAEAMKGQGTLKLMARLVDSCPTCVLQPRTASRFIDVSVSDSGPGIPSDILPRIFEPFFTTKNAGATPGTGLGLSTVYTMAEQDGLGLAVATGQGTTFRIIIPVGATSPVLDDKIQHTIGIHV